MATKCVFNPPEIDKDIALLLDTVPAEQREEAIKLKMLDIKENYILEETSTLDASNVVAQIIMDLLEFLDLTEEVEQDFFNLETLIKNMEYVYSGGEFTKKDASEQLTDSIGSENRREASSLKFLKDWYGGAKDAIKYAKIDMDSHLIDSLFLGRGILSDDNLGTILGKELLNNNMRKLLDKLFSRIIKYLNTRNLTDEQKLEIAQNNVLYRLNPNGRYTYTRAFEKLNSIIKNFLEPGLKISTLRLQALYEDTIKGNEEAKIILQAYNAFAFLSNFDTYLSKLLGDSISILSFQRRTGEDKYNISPKSEGTVNFRESDPDVEKEVGKITKAIINILPYYLRGKKDPVPNRYMSFLKFEHIIGKIKALTISNDVINVKFDASTKNSVFWRTLSKETLNFIDGKRLSEVISLIRVNAGKTLSSLFEILNNSEFQRLHKNDIFSPNNFDSNELSYLWSLYKGIFDLKNTNSIISVSDSKQKINYYNYITLLVNTIYNNQFVQIYVNPKGEIKTRLLFDTTLDNIKRDIEEKINNNLSSRFNGLSNNLYLNQILDLTINPIKDKSKVIGISYQIPNTNIIAEVIFATLEVKYKQNDQPISDFRQYFNDKDFLKFTDSFTFLNLAEDDVYKSQVRYLATSDNDVMYRLIGMTSRIIANQYANMMLINHNSSKYSDIQALVENIFGENSNFQYISARHLTQLVSPFDNDFIRNILVKAKASIEERNTAIQINDSTQASQSLQSFSRLIGSITSQWDLIERKQPVYARDERGRLINELAVDSEGRVINHGSASRNFSILNNSNLFEGYYASHEFYQPGNTSKKMTDFTVAELVYSGVICHFAPSLWRDSDDKYKFINNGKAMFLASVNSDKNMIGYIRSDINTLMPVYNRDANGNLVKIGEKSYVEFTPEEHQLLISKELGEYYANMYTKIVDDFKALSDFIIREQLTRIVKAYPNTTALVNQFPGFDYGNNFKAYKNWFEQMNLAGVTGNAYDFMMEMVLRYNQTHRTNPIEITDQIYVTGNKLQRNESIISQLFTFNPKFLQNSIGIDNFNKLQYLYNDNNEIIRDNNGFPVKNSNYYNSEDFWKMQNSEVTRTLINSSFYVDLFSNTSDKVLLVKYLTATYSVLRRTESGKEIKECPWISKDNYLIYSKFNYKGKTYDISGPADIRKIEIATGKNINDIINQDLGEFILNPIFEKYNYMDYLITQEWMNAGVGSFVAHPNKAKINKNNTISQESSRFLAQHKRNVSWTALMNQELLNELHGIPEYFNVSVIKDIKDIGTVISGKNNSIKPYDGATIVNPFIVHLENNSLGGNAVGLTKKDFAHFKNGQLGTGGIIKTANFPITNDVLRRSPLFHNLFKKMTDLTWIDENGVEITDLDINTNYLNRQITYQANPNKESGIFFKGKDGNYYKVTRILKVGPNTYNRFVLQVGKKDFHLTLGDEVMMDLEGNITDLPVTINTNYRLWQAFGGKWALEPSENKLQPSERSIELVVLAMNEIGFDRRNGGKPLSEETILSQNEIYQPLKHSDIHWLVTEGAIKQGAANINSEKRYHDSRPLNFQRIRMLQMGPQLDKEHHADNAEVSLMTLVMSACALTGYTSNLSKNLYKGLRRITEIACKNLFDSLSEATKGKAVLTNINKFVEDCTKILIKSLESDSGDSFAENISHDIKNAVDKNLTSYVKAVFPISDNTIFNKAISNFANQLSKIGIRLKVLGVLAVLNPSYELYKLYDGKKFDSLNNPNEELERIQLSKENNPIYLNGFTSNLSELEMGRVYEIIYNENINYDTDFFTDNTVNILTRRGDETDSDYEIRLNQESIRELNRLANPALRGAIVRIKLNPDNYHKIKLLVRENKINRIVEWVKDGRNLGAYNVRYYGTVNGEVQRFQLWDLDSIKYKHILKELIEISQDLDVNEINKFIKNRLGLSESFVIAKDEPWVITRNRLFDKFLQAFGFNFNLIDTAKLFFDKQVQKDLERLTNSIPTKQELFQNILKERQNANSEEELRVWQKHLQYFINNELTEHDLIEYRYKLAEDSNFDVLSWIQNSDSLQNIVIIDGQKVLVEPSTLEIQPFELIMPKHWIKEFGFNEFTDLNTVQNDPDYFIKQGFRNKNHSLNVYRSEYDIVFENTNGEHYYFIDKAHLSNSGLDPVLNEELNTRVDSDGTIWLLDSKGNELHEILPNTRVYKSKRSNTYVYAVDSIEDIKEYLDIIPHNSINLSDNVFLQGSYVIDLLNTLKDSSKWANALLDKATKFTDNVTFKDIDDTIDDNIYNSALVLNILNTLLDWNIVNENNYREMLENGVINDSHPIVRAGKNKYVSFLKSLDIVAARIPAQAMQSFMCMKTVAYDNMNINNAYVSDLLFFLQGSDLDIDSVTLCTYSLNKGGLIDTWSPYSITNNKDFLEKSMHLPLPTGNKIQIKEDSKYEDVIKFLVKYKDLFNFVSGPKGLHYTFHNNINKIGELVSETEIPQIGITDFENFKLAVSKIWPNCYLVDFKLSEFIFKSIAEVINKHNLYLNDKPQSKLFSIMNNYILQLMYDIISDPVNLMAALVSVDEVTDPIKRIAADRGYQTAVDNSRRSAGNSQSKYESINDNQEGKDCIARSASCLKGFFATLSYYNNVLNNGTTEELKRLIGRNKKGDFNFILSNIKAKDITTVTNEEVLDAIVSIDTPLDAVSFLSALLGLSADNAKELILSKINAGSDMIGMYLFGIAKGIDINEISRVLMSSTGRTLRKVVQGNIFTGEKSYMRASLAFSYFTLDGLKSIMNKNKDGIEAFKNALKANSSIKSVNELFGVFNGQLNVSELLDLLDNIRESELQKSTPFTPLLRLVRDIENYMLDYKNTTKEDLNLLKELAYGADEFVTLGKLIMNKELPNTVENVINKISTLENILIDSAEKYTKYYRLKNPTSMPTLDITKSFFGDELEKNINLLESVKININILDVVNNVLHLKGYIKELIAMDNFFKERSYRYRSLREQFNSIKKQYRSLDSNYILKRLSEYILSSMISEWLTSTKKSFILPAGSYYFDENTGKRSKNVTTKDRLIYLGEDWANQTFRMFVEQTIIPNLKNGNIGFDSSGNPIKGTLIKDNPVIKDLAPSSRNNTILGNISLVYTLPIDMIPAKDSIDELKLNSYIDAFLKLKSYSDYNYKVDPEINNGETLAKIPIFDVMMLYTMFAHDWKNSKNSLINLFKQEMLSYDGNGNPVINNLHDSYMVYIDSLDKSNSSISDLLKLRDNLIPYLATKESPFSSNSEHIIYGTPSEGNMLLINSHPSDEEEALVLIGGKYRKFNSSADIGYFTAGQMMYRDKKIDQDISLLYYDPESGKTRKFNSTVTIIWNGKNNKILIRTTDFGKDKASKTILSDLNREITLEEIGLKEIPIKAKVAKDGTFTRIPYVDTETILSNLRNRFNKKSDC